ncbi:asparaginase [Actinomycetaceae bacterium L2_0104]
MAQPIRVALASLGGTITMSSDDGHDVTPTLTADDLTTPLSRWVRGVEIEAETLQNVGSPQLTVHDALRTLDFAHRAVDAGARGVVVVQGTDTVEESAYLLDLLWDRPEPIVFTGAMRSADEAGAEGAGNLVASIRAATDPAMTGNGVLVVFNDEVHLATHVTKSDANALAAFSSAGWGPIARRVEDNIHVAYHRAERCPALPAPSTGAIRIPLLVASYDDDGGALAAIAKTQPDGVVISSMGSGHMPIAMADAAERAIAGGIPVVFATRTGAGTTTRATYGYPGSEADLLRRGLIGAGWLHPRKARLLLHVLVQSGASRQRIEAEFAARGQ